MLTEDEKARIRAEEQFRRQIRQELRSKDGRTTGAKIWRTLNSAFALWVLSSVVVGTATCYYNDRRQAAETEQEDRRQLAAAQS